MEFKFKNHPAYVLARKFLQLCFLHFEKAGFIQHKELKQMIEDLALKIIVNTVHLSGQNSEEENSVIKKDLQKNINEIVALYDVVLEIGIIQQKDIYTIETYLQEIADEIQISEK
ncbi:MAG: hypothetical protein KAI57_04490 [Candidatus Pacebacteria bacterium]|nr:hypothetical protein [Candidatus Paceibacterota bacterium]